LLLFLSHLPCRCYVAALLCLSEDPCTVVDCNIPGALEKVQQAELNVSRISNMMLVGSGGLLTFQNIIISEIATGDQYVYSPFQVGCYPESLVHA
jgi:hypothetical protein